MKTSPVIPSKHLSVDASPMSVERGNLTTAKNVRICGDGRMRARRGQERISLNDYMGYGYGGNSSLPVNTFWYNNKIWQIVADANNFSAQPFVGYLTNNTGSGVWRYSRMNDLGWMPLASGSYAPGSKKFRYPISEANRRLFVGTSIGALCSPKLETDYLINKTIAAATPQTNLRIAGVPRGLEPTCSVVDTSGTSNQNWLANNCSVAYRVLWRKTDENGIETVGAASARRTLVNTAGASRAVSLVVPVPKELRDAYAAGDYSYAAMFSCDIYRTKSLAPDGSGTAPDPGDECLLATTHIPTAAELAAYTLAVTDICADAVLGEPLYTNETQEGALQERIRPPVYTTSEVYSDCLFFGGIKDKWSLDFSLLAVADGGGVVPAGLAAGDVLVVGNKAMIPVAVPVATYEFQLDTTAGPGSQVTRIQNTTRALVDKFNLYQDSFIAMTAGSPNEPYGSVTVEERIVGGSRRPFLAMSKYENTSMFSPAPIVRQKATVGPIGLCYKIVGTDSVLNTINVSVGGGVTLTDVLGVGDTVNIVPLLGVTAGTYSPIDIAEGEQTVLAISNYGAGVWGIKLTGVTISSSLGAGTYGAAHVVKSAISNGTPTTPAVGMRNIKPNRVYWSPALEPECTTPVNWMDVGRSDAEILRLIRFNDTLFVFKEDGLFKITGYSGDFIQTLYDANLVLVSPRLVDASMGAMFAFTYQGVIRITESTTETVSGGRIDTLLMPILYSTTQRVVNDGFCVGYGDDNSVTFWLPSTANSFNTVAFVYDGVGWTERDDDAVDAIVACDVTGAGSGIQTDYSRLYVVRAGVNWITRERKSMSIIDYCDEKLTIDTALSSFTPATATTGSCSLRISFGTNTSFLSGMSALVQEFQSLEGSVLDASYTNGSSTVFRKAVLTSCRISSSGTNYLTITADYDFKYSFGTMPGALFTYSAAHLYIPIQVDYSMAANDIDSPDSQKTLSEFSILFDKPLFLAATNTFYTDLYPAGASSPIYGHLDPNYNETTFWTTFSADYGNASPQQVFTRNTGIANRTIRTFVPRDTAICSSVEVRIQSSIALQNFCVLGHFFSATQAEPANIQR